MKTQVTPGAAPGLLCITGLVVAAASGCGTGAPAVAQPTSEARTEEARDAVTGTWTLWADPSSGLPGIAPFKYPRMWIDDNHTFYYTGSASSAAGLGGTDGLGRVWKSSNDPASPVYKHFTLMPQTGLIQGGEQKVATNLAGDPIVVTNGAALSGTVPIIFRFDSGLQKWVAPTLLGGATWPAQTNGRATGLARAPDGTIWVTARSGIYKSTDGGASFAYLDIYSLLPGTGASVAARKQPATVFGSTLGLAVSAKGVVYVGSEGAGFVSSADNGATWGSIDPNYTSASSQVKSGWTNNSYAAGFNKDGNLLTVGGLNSISNLPFTNVGTNLYLYDVAAHTDQFVNITPGVLQYQASDTRTLVTTASGQNFIMLQNNGAWTSPDGMSWSAFNTGMVVPTYTVAGSTVSFAEGSIAVDGNDVFVGTADGKIWNYRVGSAAPVVSGLNPSTANAGGPTFTLTVNGQNFIGGSIVRWNGSDRSTSFVGATQLHATINAADIAAAGNDTVTVFNPAPGGGTSAPTTFSVTAVQDPSPVLSAGPTVSPLPAFAGQTLTFSATAVDGDGDGEPLTYTWAFNDGTTGVGATVTHSYATAQAFTPTVTVTDGLGGTKTASTSFRVYNRTVGLWKLDDGSGAGAIDSSGNGNTCSLQPPASPPTWIAAPGGKSGGALLFQNTPQASSNWLDCGDGPTLQLGGKSALTLAAWVKTSQPFSGATTQAILTKDNEKVTQYSLRLIGGTGTLRFSLRTTANGVSSLTNVDSAQPVTPNAWQHTAATYDGATMRLFVNGTLSGSAAKAGAMIDNGIGVRVGARSVVGSSFSFQGAIDEARVYDKALAQPEIQDLVNLLP